jgi:hypothetical protein
MFVCSQLLMGNAGGTPSALHRMWSSQMTAICEKARFADMMSVVLGQFFFRLRVRYRGETG